MRIEGDAAHHLARSLRVRPGETIVVVEDGSVEHGVSIAEAGSEQITGRVLWSRPATGEPRLRVHVIQAIPAQAMDAAVEALAAAGAATISPVITERSVSRPDAGRGRKHQRWTAIAREAAQLAGRAMPPTLEPVRPLDEAIAALPAPCPILACVVGPEALALRSVPLNNMQQVALVIGPEGGLGDRDLALLDEKRARRVHIGGRVMPARLAGAVALTVLLSAHGDLDTATAPAPA